MGGSLRALVFSPPLLPHKLILVKNVPGCHSDGDPSLLPMAVLSACSSYIEKTTLSLKNQLLKAPDVSPSPHTASSAFSKLPAHARAGITPGWCGNEIGNLSDVATAGIAGGEKSWMTGLIVW